jgi:hypothetical protein
MDKENKENLKKIDIHYDFLNSGTVFMELSRVRKFVEEMDRLLKQENNKILKEKEERRRNGGGISISFDIPYIFTIPDILWRAMFLHTYFLLESSLDKICNNVDDTNKCVFKLNDIGKKGIDRSAFYLSRVVGIENFYKSDHWKVIKELNKIRNVLVHSDGYFVRDNRNDLISICENKDYDGIGVVHIPVNKMAITISKEFVLFSLDHIEKFFEELNKEMKDKNLSD